MAGCELLTCDRCFYYQYVNAWPYADPMQRSIAMPLYVQKCVKPSGECSCKKEVKEE